MNLLEAVAYWYACPYGLKNCKDDCCNYLFVDPRPYSSRGIGPGRTGQRTLCSLLDDMNDQVKKKTEDLD